MTAVHETGKFMINGIINVYKEKGYTSFDVVAKLRGILKTKKIGHTGTLDPDAEGVLPVCLGKATKVCDLLTDKNKEYVAVMLLGKVTDTQDTTGTVLEEHPVEVTEEQVKEAVLSAAEVLKSKGAIVEEFDLSLVEYAIPTYYTIAAAEASSNLERFDGVKYGFRAKDYDGLHSMYKKTRSEGFGPEVKRRIMLGSFVLSSGYYDAYYLKALRVKAMIKKAFDEAFAKYDVILGPVAPTTAPKLGSSLADPIKMYLGDIYTISVNLAGLPGISVPCGKDDNGLPIGVQLIGDCFNEKKLIQTAYAYEQARGKFE